MIRIISLAAAAMLAAAPAFAEKLTPDQLNAYMAVAPAAPQGWTRADRAGNYSSNSASTFSVTYTAEDGKRFMFTIIFSKDQAEQSRDLMKDPKQADRWGYTVGKIKGRDALVKKPDSKNTSANYLVVISDSRSVSVMEMGPGVDRALLKGFFEAVDFDAIAKK
jgi:hypothetical protein